MPETSHSPIYTLGDITGHSALTPVAIAAVRHLADRLFGGEIQTQLDYTETPSVIFSHPPAGSIDLNEDDAKKMHTRVSVYETFFTPYATH